MDLSEKEYRLLADFIYEKSGIDLGDSKQQLVKTRLQKRIRKLGLESFKEYYDYVIKQKSGDELTELLDAISTNYTFFFRERDHFDFLSKKGIDQIIQKKQKNGSRKLRVWCAAASTGEEPYTILITLMEKIKNLGGWDFKMLATDISTKVLKKCQVGVYQKKQLEELSPLLRDKYFDAVVEDNEKKYMIKEEVKSLISFRRFNLITSKFPFKGKFDIIFCRNVMIYFDRPTQESLNLKMLNAMEPQGFYFIAHSETLSGPAKSLVKPLGSAYFQKL